MTTTVPALSQPDEFLCRAQEEDKLRQAIAYAQRQQQETPPALSPSLATRRLSNAVHAFLKAGVDYAGGDMAPVTRITVTDQATGADDFVGQMPAEAAELMAMALGTVTRLMIAENRAAAERRASDTNRPALRVVTERDQDAAEYAAAQALRAAQDHRDDADLRSYRPTGGES